MAVKTGIMITHGSMAVLAGSLQAIWLDQIGLSGDPDLYFLQETITMPDPSPPGTPPAPVSPERAIQVWLLSEGMAGNVFVPNPGFETPKATASLVDNQVDTSTVIINR